MANPSVRSASRASGGTATEPTGAQGGNSNSDILVAMVISTSAAPSPPAGWPAADFTLVWGSGNNRVSLYSLKRGASAPSLTWTTSGTIWGINMWCVQDANQSTWLAATPVGTDNATSTTPLSPSITTLTANSLILVGESTTGAHDVTQPSGFTADTALTAVDDVIANQLQAAAGASGTKQWTLNTTDISGTITMAIRAASPMLQDMAHTPQHQAMMGM